MSTSLNKISENTHLYPKADIQKRGVFILAAELINGGHTYISLWKKIFANGGGPHLAIFNELQLANWYLCKLKDDLKEGTSGLDFKSNGFFCIQEITNQEVWNHIRKYLITDNVKTAVVNPCLEKATDTHNCMVRPFDLETFSDFNMIKEWFESLPYTHTNITNIDTISSFTLVEQK